MFIILDFLSVFFIIIIELNTKSVNLKIMTYCHRNLIKEIKENIQIVRGRSLFCF